ncbi:helix-turn-helix domain-containing protein [Actomonas aquatica]|uniref:Helix-turn-helix domain-containing protein n=1 Tax=Actomonas aquatica TaxID=2866162 RepID=A0ABZ1C6L8_9BACT|nr:helix-turn-helix domain-containing protein [Opitutus sp. WL0086]WRQ87372.1 helix-turn-helix domain-containing protein [Opitutus sp. WL0086]
MSFQPDPGAATAVSLWTGLLPPEEWRPLLRRYRAETGYALVAVAADGTPCLGEMQAPACARQPSCRDYRVQAVQEALRWGEPTVLCCGCGRLMWAVPVMVNQQVRGGLLVAGVPLREPTRAGALDRRVREAGQRLLDMAEEAGLTNAALLAQRRADARREREKAEALHVLKDRLYDDIRSIYLREEPALLAAIRRGERREARHVINRVLTVIYSVGGSQVELLKSMAMELVVMMTRAAVQAGGDPTHILGINYQSLTGLAKVADSEELATWLCAMLEQVIDGIEASDRHPNAVQLARALDYMEAHLAEALPRDEVARAAGLSPSRFSHLMRAKLGMPFTELLTRLRVDRACHLLAHSQRELAQVALECGFGDQSYFSRVFRKQTGCSPSDYRQGRHQSPKD